MGGPQSYGESPSGPLGEPPASHNAWWHLARAEQLLEMAARPESFSTVEYLVLRAHAHRELARTIQEILIMQPVSPVRHLGGQGGAAVSASGGGGGGSHGGGTGGPGGTGGTWRPA